MRNFLLIFILTFSFQSLVKANDIRDFQIEGMSIGDSLLNFFSKKEINKFANYDDLPSDMKFRIAEFYSNNEMKMNTYDGIQIFYKPNDKKYILHSLGGFIDCEKKSQSDCEKIFNDISKDLREFFKEIKPFKNSFKHPDDKSKNSIVKILQFDVSGGSIAVKYTNWSNTMNYSDHVSVDVNTIESDEWMMSNYGID